MSGENLSIAMRAPSGEVLEGAIQTRGGELLRVSLIGPAITTHGEGHDYFDALMNAREEFELAGWRVLVYGASRNVWPSGMARDMGLGLKAYRLTLGERPKLSDLVRTFGSGEDLDPVTVEDQRAFHAEWLRSVGVSPG